MGFILWLNLLSSSLFDMICNNIRLIIAYEMRITINQVLKDWLDFLSVMGSNLQLREMKFGAIRCIFEVFNEDCDKLGIR